MLASIASMSQAILDTEMETFVTAQLAITNYYDRASDCTSTECADNTNCNGVKDVGAATFTENSDSFALTDYPDTHPVAFVHIPKSG